MSDHHIDIERDGRSGWVVRSDRCLFERFPSRRDAVRHAATLARRASACGLSAIVRLRAPRERTKLWDPQARSAGL